MLRVLSGMALLRSMAIVRPKPRHSGHAPSGLLKLKRPGVGGRISRSQCGQCQPVEKGVSDCGSRIAERFLVSEIAMTLIFPLPKRRAVSMASVSLVRLDSLIAIRS